jgi:glycosyltransferase involved in cell wall biosynthesis
MGGRRPESFVDTRFGALGQCAFFQGRPSVLPTRRIHLVPLAVIPARNEGLTVAEVVTGVRAYTPCDVLVVDDASTDHTARAAGYAGATVISLVNQLGAWGATQAGIRYAHRNGYRTLITLDADGQHLPYQLPALLAAHRESGANVVIGTCSERLSVAKRLAARYFRFITGIAVQDFTSVLRVYDRRAIRTLASREASLLDYQDLGVLMLLRKKGLAMKEVPSSMSPRRSGGSRVFSSWRMVARYMLHTTVLCFAQVSARGRIGRRAAKAGA